MTYRTRLRKVGGSVMLAIPPAFMEMLDLAVDAPVGLAVKAGRLVVEPQGRKRYSLDELLAECDSKARRTPADKEWVTGGRAGLELL